VGSSASEATALWRYTNVLLLVFLGWAFLANQTQLVFRHFCPGASTLNSRELC